MPPEVWWGRGCALQSGPFTHTTHFWECRDLSSYRGQVAWESLEEKGQRGRSSGNSGEGQWSERTCRVSHRIKREEGNEGTGAQTSESVKSLHLGHGDLETAVGKSQIFNRWNLALAFGDHYMHTRPPILLSTYNIGLCHFPPPQESLMKLPPPPPWLACRTPCHFAGRGRRTNKSIRPLEKLYPSPSFPQWTPPIKHYKFRPRFQAVHGCPLIKPCHQPIGHRGQRKAGKRVGIYPSHLAFHHKA